MTTRKHLSPDEVQSVLRMIGDGKTDVEIAGIFNMSRSAIYAYRNDLRSGAREAPAPFVMPKPHAMPWVTRDMLTGARAPVARVRS